MPVYTYRCEVCGVQFDHRQGFDEPMLRRCPECGEEALRRVYRPVGIVFKGSGFYATDHRSPSGNVGRKQSAVGASASSSQTGGTDKGQSTSS